MCPELIQQRVRQLAGMEISDAQIRETIGTLWRHVFVGHVDPAAMEMYIGREFPLESAQAGRAAPGLHSIRLRHDERGFANTRQTAPLGLDGARRGVEALVRGAGVPADGLASIPTGGARRGLWRSQGSSCWSGRFTPEQTIRESHGERAAAYLFQAKDIGPL